MITYSIDNDITLNDNKKPFKPFLKSEIVPLSTSIFKSYIREMSEIILNSDNSLLFPYFEETKTYIFTQKREEVDMRKEHANVPGAYSQMNFFANTNTLVYNRSYRKLFEVIVQIGGFSNGIIYSAYIILYLYSRNIILWSCIASIISPKEINENLGNVNIKSKNEIIHSRIFNKQKENIKNVNNEVNSSSPPSQLQINNNNNNNNNLR